MANIRMLSKLLLIWEASKSAFGDRISDDRRQQLKNSHSFSIGKAPEKKNGALPMKKILPGKNLEPSR
jgi:hypothetical protein